MATPCEERDTTARSGADDVALPITILPTNDVTSPETALPTDDVTPPGTTLATNDVTPPGTTLATDDVTPPGTTLATDDVTPPVTTLATDDVTPPGTTLPDDDVRKSTATTDLQLSTEDNEPINQPCNVTGRAIQEGAELLSMGEVLRSQLQDSETTFVQANSKVVADSERSRCVQTADLEDASDILQETGRVILCGFPGTGKTTVGHALLRRCREEGFKPYILSKLEDWHAHIGPGRRSFVLIDAILGEVRVNRQQYEEWRHILHNMLELIKAEDCRVVVTLYPHVLHELQQLETDSQSPLLDSSAVLRLMEEDLDTAVKRKLLYFHLKQLPLQPSQQQELVERIVQADTSGPAFLWCCRYLVDHWQAVEDPATVFTSPAEAYSVLLKQMCLHDTHGDSFAAVLALAMLGKGRFLHMKTGVQSELKKLRFKEYCDDHLAEYEDILLGSVLSEKACGFDSRGWYDAAGLALGRSFRLPTLLRVCDVTFLLQHVHVKVTGDTQKGLKILVGSGPFASLVRNKKRITEDCHSLSQRLCEEISKGSLPEICRQTALRCSEFLLEMTEYCTKEKYSLKQLVRAADTVHDLPLLYWSAINERHAMTEWCLSMLDLTTEEDLKLFSLRVLLGLCTKKQAFVKGLLSATSVQCSQKVLFLPHTQTAACAAGRETSFYDSMVEEGSNIQKLHYQCDPSLPIPPSLVTVKAAGDGVTVQVRDRGDWYLALRLLADREVDETDRDGNTLLHIAVDKGNLEAITLAVKSGASLTKTNNNGLTPYQLAQRRRKKLNNATDRDKMAFDLFSAIRGGNDVTVKTLLCHGSSVHDKDAEGRTGLVVACKEGQGNIADLLIDLGADVNVSVTSRWECPQTPLFFACRTGLIRTVELLLKHNAVVDAIHACKETALHYACQCKSPTARADITRLLLDAGADVNAQDTWGNTPLHFAAWSSNIETLRRLIHHEADLNAKDNEGRTTLHHAYTASRPGIISQLVEAGAETGPVHQAVVRGDVDALMTLLQQGADVNQHDTSMGCSPLHAACLMGRTDIVTCLTQHGAHVNAVDDRKKTPLHIACHTGVADIVTCLAQHGAQVNAVDGMIRTPLHYACAAGQTQEARQLNDEAADVNVRDNSTPLDKAADKGNIEIVVCLLEHGAQVDAAADYDFTPLLTACRNGHTETAQCLLQNGANVNAVSKRYGTPLHTACRNGHTQTAQCLLQHGANVNAVSKWNRTPLHTACEKGHTQTAQCLLQHGADVNVVSEFGTPLHRACENGHTETAQCLLQHGANVNAESERDCIPLLTACGNGHTETAQCLLQHGANVNAVSKWNETPLHATCQNGHTETAQCLLQHGADVNAVSRRRCTPLDVARRNGQHSNDMVTLLSQHGAVSRDQVTRTT